MLWSLFEGTKEGLSLSRSQPLAHWAPLVSSSVQLLEGSGSGPLCEPNDHSEVCEAGRVAQWLKMLATKPKDLSSFPRGRRGRLSPRSPLSSDHYKHVVAHIPDR